MRGFRRDEDGQVLVIVALTLSVLLLGTGLAVDSGRLFVARRTAQAAADAGAWAGAVLLSNAAGAAAARDAALLDLGRNGFASGPGRTVTVSSPPTSGEFVGDPAYVEVVIDELVRTLLLPGVGGGQSRVVTRAVGGTVGAATGDEGILTLDPGLADAFAISGINTLVTVTGGAITVDSSSPLAASISGSASATADLIRVVGGAVDLSTGTFSPPPVTGARRVPDPFAALPPPSTSGLLARADPLAVAGRVTLQPGVYPSITVSTAASVTFATGIYVVRGPVSITGTGALTADRALIYTTYSTYPAAFGLGALCGDVTLGTDMTATAPTSGRYFGMFLFQDRSCARPVAIAANGGRKTTLTGTIYAPRAALTVNGVGSTTTLISQIVVGKFAQAAGRLTLDVRDRSKLARALVAALTE